MLFKGFFVYALVGFGPFWLISLLVGLGLLLDAPGKPGPASIGTALAFLAGPPVVAAAAYALSLRWKRWAARAAALFTGLMIVCAGPVYLFLATDAQGIQSGDKVGNPFSVAASGMALPAQLCLLPWFGVAFFLLWRFGARIFAPGEDEGEQA